MPECRHCQRILPSGELRRTQLGYVCLERAVSELGKRSRCYQISQALRAAARAAQRTARKAAA